MCGGFRREFTLVLTGDDQDDDVRSHFLYLARKLMTAHPGHIDVGDLQVDTGSFFLHNLQCRQSVRGFQDLVAGMGQRGYGGVEWGSSSATRIQREFTAVSQHFQCHQPVARSTA